MRRVVLLVTSPRLPAGLLTAQAWDLVRAHPEYAAVETDTTVALSSAGAAVSFVEARPELLLDAVAEHGTVVWLASPGGDEALARELGLRLARSPALAELELLYGSWDPPGARLLDVVTVMDRLLSPGGDPWLRGMSHGSLARYLLEEAYEAYDALSSEDLSALREELGDVLLQIVLHARMAESWSIDDVAAGLVEKLVRRNPHVFGDAVVGGVDEITENWERIKLSEKSRDAVPLSQPALSLAAKVLDRARRSGLAAPVPPAAGIDDDTSLGAALLALVAAAAERGLDPEGALRRVVLGLVDAVRTTEK
jgi:XTP/dITP diphosphohydrolase